MAVAIAHLTERRLELHSLPPIDDRGCGGVLNLRITDLMEIPIPWRTAEEGRHWTRWSWPPISQTVVLGPGVRPDGPRLAAFGNGRRRTLALDQLREAAAPANVWIDVDPLALYSYSFLLDEGHTLYPVMAGVRPRERYRCLGQQVAQRLGEFDCLHLRLGDFVGWAGAPRTGRVSAAEVLENLRAVLPSTAPLLILTDEPRHSLVREVEHAFPASRVFERWLDTVEVTTTSGRALTGAEVALLGQIVAMEARTFIGTMCSTFTALIQRSRGARSFLFAYNQFPEVFDLVDCALEEEPGAGRFSWQRLRRKTDFDPEAFAWFREWPEAVPDGPGSGSSSPF
jgi:hypothetical protein